jgi:tRNA dimethylallyltransferase
MDIGTAKPSAAMRARVAHHLMDIRDPAESYSAGEFTRDAACGHAGYLAARAPAPAGRRHHAVLPRLDSRHCATCPQANAEVRADIERQAEASGGRPCTRSCEQVDPAAAARIHVNDPQRIQRALEVYRLTGETITGLQQTRMSVFADVEVMEFIARTP